MICGEKITVVADAGQIVNAVVHVVFTLPGGEVFNVRVGSRLPMHRGENEGVTWIRGHHEPDSPEVRALQAASALARDSAESRRAYKNARFAMAYGGAGTFNDKLPK